MKSIFTIAAFLSASFLLAQNTFTEVEDLPSSAGSESMAMGDFNNDGYEDLYIGFSAHKNQLWRNNGDGTFTDVAGESGVAMTENDDTKTVAWGDIDNDGDLDLYVANKQKPDKLFLNNGEGTFTDISMAANIFNLGWPQSVNMADVDGDGFLDIYVSNFLQQNILFQNNGNLTFSNKTVQSGALDEGKSMGTVFFDYDLDGDVDLYLVHDHNQPNLLYQNDGTGHFTEVGAAAGVNTASFGMGVDVGDINNDGWPDLYITNLYPNFLLLNNGDGTFTDITESAWVDDSGMSWGVNFLDFDNDGWLDIYVSNEFQFSPWPNVLYRNKGNETFEKAETDEPVCNLMGSYGAAIFDYNLDGNIDIAVANKNEGDYAQVFQNADRPGNWLGIKLIGVESNRQAVGAKIRFTDDQGKLHYDELTAGNGWMAQSTHYFHFGLGDAGAVEEMTVFWPSGLEQNIEQLELGKYYTIVEGQAPVEGISFGTATPAEEVLMEKGLEVEVFPNPSEGEFFIKISSGKQAGHQIKITDQLGQVVVEKRMDGHSIKEKIVLGELGNFSRQMLFINILSGGKSVVRKMAVNESK